MGDRGNRSNDFPPNNQHINPNHFVNIPPPPLPPPPLPPPPLPPRIPPRCMPSVRPPIPVPPPIHPNYPPYSQQRMLPPARNPPIPVCPPIHPNYPSHPEQRMLPAGSNPPVPVRLPIRPNYPSHPEQKMLLAGSNPPVPVRPPIRPNYPSHPEQRMLPAGSNPPVPVRPPIRPNYPPHPDQRVLPPANNNNPPVPVQPPFRPNYPQYPGQRMLPPASNSSVFSPLWSNSMPHSSSSPVKMAPPPHLTEQSGQGSASAQSWVDQWAKNRGKSDPVRCDIKIHMVKEKLDAAFKLVRELENSSRTLGVMVKTVSSAEWKQKCSEVEEKKRQLLNIFNEVKLTDTEFKLLREKLLKRTKKRARLRRQSERKKKQKEEEKIKMQNLHFQIDHWQKEMQEEVERVKREEELKKEADAVLWGVTQKKTEAERQVDMLAALLTLRSVRVTRLTAAGQSVSQSQIDTFNTVIERLKNMWSRHLKECQLEEQALRGMLGVHTQPIHTATDSVKTHKKLVLNEWEAAIFGSTGTVDSSLSADELISIRRAWDRFTVREQSLLASPVPPGYVLPVQPSSDLWRSFLKY